MQLWNNQNTPKNASESASFLPEIRFRLGGFAPLVPLPGLCPGPTGGLGGPKTPCLLCFHIVQGLATPLVIFLKTIAIFHLLKRVPPPPSIIIKLGIDTAVVCYSRTWTALCVTILTFGRVTRTLCPSVGR